MGKRYSSRQRIKIRRILESKTRRELTEVAKLTRHTAKRMRISENNLRSRGVPQSVINENLLDMAGSVFGPAVGDVMKNYVFDKIVEMFDLQPESGLGKFLFKVVRQLFEAVEYTEISKYFGEGSCPEIMNLFTEAGTEVIIEEGAGSVLGYILEHFFPDWMTDMIQGSLDTIFASVPIEAMNEVVTGFLKMLLKKPIEEHICNASLSDMVQGSSGDAASLMDLGSQGNEFLSRLQGIDMGDFDLGSLLGGK